MSYILTGLVRNRPKFIVFCAYTYDYIYRDLVIGGPNGTVESTLFPLGDFTRRHTQFYRIKDDRDGDSHGNMWGNGTAGA